MAKTIGAQQVSIKYRLYKKELDGTEIPVQDFRTQQDVANYLGYKNQSYFSLILNKKIPTSFHHQYRLVNLTRP